MSNGALILALPSKGRLKEETEALLARAGCPVETRGGRQYRGGLAGMEKVELAFLAVREAVGGDPGPFIEIDPCQGGGQFRPD